MAYGLSIACAYVEHVLKRGLNIDRFARGLTFNFDVYGNLWEQVCKFRAGRRLWARLLKERYGATDERCMQLRMIAGGGGGGLTVQQPENNIMRGAYYALASALSGTQTMALCSYDEAYTIPSEHAAKLSLRTMQLLIHEIGLCDTVDPLAGSYFIESQTNAMEAEIVRLMDAIDEQGGIIAGIAAGRVQAAVNLQAYEREKDLLRGDVKKVGVNVHCEDEEENRDIEFHPYRAEEANKQVERLAALRARRDEAQVHATLGKLGEAARVGRNVMPETLDAVEAYATVGEVCNVLKEVFGTYQEPVRF